MASRTTPTAEAVAKVLSDAHEAIKPLVPEIAKIAVPDSKMRSLRQVVQDDADQMAALLDVLVRYLKESPVPTKAAPAKAAPAKKEAASTKRPADKATVKPAAKNGGNGSAKPNGKNGGNGNGSAKAPAKAAA